MRGEVVVALVLCCGVAEAGQHELARERARLQEKGAPGLTVAEEAQLTSRGWRDRRDGEWRPPVGSTFRPADYQNPRHRGTVKLDVGKWRNYSWHLVKAPNGTVIDCGDRGCNFTQIAPQTEVFLRTTGFGHNLTFTGRVNLVNVKIHPDWNFINFKGNTAQIDRVGTIDPDGKPQITENVYVANHPDNIPAGRTLPVSALR